jgi:hypothetical protein
MSLPQPSLADIDDWRAANKCDLNDKLFQAGMQAPDDELLEYGHKVDIFFASDPGRGKSVIRYMGACEKTWCWRWGCGRSPVPTWCDDPTTIREFAQTPHCVEGGELDLAAVCRSAGRSLRREPSSRPTSRSFRSGLWHAAASFET